MIKSHLDSAESHSIHQRRATTVILEEDQDDGINMIIPISSQKISLQVEEIGSYKLGSQGQSFSYHDIDGFKNHAIIDEIDSDTDGPAGRSRTTSRNISINSVSEDDSSVPRQQNPVNCL